MKISILTFHFTRNYGASLQAFALSRFLRSRGHDAQIIDYVPEVIARDYALFQRGKPGLVKELVKLPFVLLRNWKFARFLAQGAGLSRKYRSRADLDQMPPVADLFIVGSDQVWNSHITGGLDPVYYLDFVHKGLKISYAASFGKPVVGADELKMAGALLTTFAAISVREDSAAGFLKEYLPGRDISCVMDPVFLLNREDYFPLFNRHNPLGDYIFVYDVEQNLRLFDMAAALAKQRSWKVVAIARAHTPRHLVDKVIYSCGPAEFLGLLYNARYVVTNSFHGTAFAIIMNRDFTVNPRNLNDERINTLLGKTGLKARLAGADDNYPTGPVDFTPVNRILRAEQARSVAFLESSLDLARRAQAGGSG